MLTGFLKAFKVERRFGLKSWCDARDAIKIHAVFENLVMHTAVCTHARARMRTPHAHNILLHSSGQLYVTTQ